METRLKEAAVSISDLLPSAMRSSSSVEPLGSEVGAKKKTVEEEEEHCVIKKKTKRKKEENKQDSVSSAHHQGNGEQEHSVVNIKQKKKKKRKRNAEEEALNWVFNLVFTHSGCLCFVLNWSSGVEHSIISPITQGN